ncbi:uncharacterized protein LOC127788945 [Diospyros lotus]|uniref:uncharacterized protein LOC127788945 n=1 Tax=Diospyros lotus TaxID=55363 RepID=UPI00225BA32D|nr:uncharacterized protein LOC127788945 [Diospyros lotus]
MAGSLKLSSPSSPSSSSSSAHMKLRTLIHSLILSHVCRLARALSKAKSILIHVCKEIQLDAQFMEPLMMMMKRSKSGCRSRTQTQNQKLFYGSFRLHYNWCSSHLYYDATWSSIIGAGVEEDGCGCDGDQDHHQSQLSGYLQWLEERRVHEKSAAAGDHHHHPNDIDKLADVFIASCHEKFRLEKQESYRRFQEMMARSI